MTDKFHRCRNGVALAICALALFAVALLSQCVFAAGEGNTATAQIRIAAHKATDGSVKFAWQQAHPNRGWTDRESVGTLPANADSFHGGKEVWYVSETLIVEAVATPQGAQVAALEQTHFSALSKALPLSQWPEGWYRVSVTASGDGGHNCNQLWIKQHGIARVRFPAVGDRTNVTYERIVHVAGSTLNDGPDIIIAQDQGLEYQTVTFFANRCLSASWTLERLDWPTYSR